MARVRHNYGQIVPKVAPIFYETDRTGSFCSGDHREKSTAIQVNLTNKSRRFQCSDDCLARDAISVIYDSASRDQGQFIQWSVCEVQQVTGR